MAVLGFAGWALLSVQGAAVAVRADIARAAWLVPALLALHLVQLLLSAIAWRGLLAPHRAQGASPFVATRSAALPSLALFWRLRIVREGIDSMLPVAQVGGEIVGARLLHRLGVAAPRAGASIVVDVTLELLTQVLFLGAGLLALATLPHGGTAAGSGAGGWSPTAWLLPVVGGLAALLVLAQRFGALRGLERLTGMVARHVPGFADLNGLQAEAEAVYRRRPVLWRAAGLHGLAWLLGTAETWAVLHALGQHASPQQALVVESLGMAARSAGFALPGAIGVQEGGFVLAAAAAGLSG
ncbi:MAG: lysylphosphatidylglycerol synthase domain-containing protein, partial [Janthinobacterium lividum]